MKSFFFHYNKPASIKSGKPVISLHYDKKCHLIENIECLVPTRGRIRKDQPLFVMVGKCNSIKIKNRIAIIE